MAVPHDIRKDTTADQAPTMTSVDREGTLGSRMAAVAQTLFRESEQSRETRLRLAAERRAAVAGYRPPAGKPDKRARRLIQALGDLDAL